MDFITRLTRWVMLAGGGILIGLMLLTVADVCLRYLFNAPITGGQDISQMTLIVIVATSLAYGGVTGAHIAVDLIEKTGWRFIPWTDLLNKIISVVMMGLLTWTSFNNAVDAFRFNEGTILLRLPFGPFHLALAIGAFLYLLVLLAEIRTAITTRTE